MPAYNAAKYIRQSIDSVLAQTYSNWELLVIDDGSTDDTSKICNEYVVADKRINYYYQTNGTQGKARNLGIQKSNAGLLAFLDSDDLWLPRKLEISFTEFERGNQDLLFTECYSFNDSDDLKHLNSLTKLGVTAKTYKGESGLSDFLYQNRIPMLTVLVKKEAVISMGGFSHRGAEDYELWLKLLHAGYTLRGIENPLSLYRVHQKQATAQDKFDVPAVIVVLNDFFEKNDNIKSNYISQLKSWYKKYLKLQASSGKRIIVPSVFKEFKLPYIRYKVFLASRKILPRKIFNYLLTRFS
jgi:glycosyltransferase involved in cell wall biosynthesis